MATEITMPQLGESVTEGTISKWLVQPGDKVNKYDPLAEVMTDKVNAEVPSSFTGTIKELLVAEDETVEVGVAVCTIEVEGEESSETASAPVETDKADGTETAPSNEQADTSQKARYSPAVLKMSQEHGIDLTQVEGSGKGGRITRKDIQKVIDNGGQTSKPKSAPSVAAEQNKQTSKGTESKGVQAPSANQAPSADKADIPVAAGDVEIPVSGVRKAIAANMVKSKHEAPHAWTMVEVDVTNLVHFRNSVKGEFKQKEGFNLTFLPFFIKATVEALKEFPQLNSMWAGDKIIQKKDVNISIAVATDDALYVPVIKHADEKTIKGIGREVQELATKVRTGKLSGADMQGGTFTVNNTGSFGSVLSTPIINHPQAAILSIESIVKRPVVVESPTGDMIAIRSMVNLCLSLDHRVLDGLVCGRFLARVKEILENMTEDKTSIY
ncbi:2-oxo acid dehydrogenase subunit E2 [Alkalihalophilus marmarensis]|jgi:2-oxoisovalerate dehydrogenase E2 component (dihydrolipoyl transacylase)|uniref:Dihydrolipoamide acetyltransferase component of pyruvate dehydrogenase complex n=1 Tax=Alkalihalophilus marmarensis DSM 21297 TaxID=1188261 RepID=U6SQ24_9BACI|nr:dihydrolipoamide acetyltransferase family protein [Alkalihalophilus marmarensis]ERN52995.1 branched-chain alpha-keto acid dehydrogenase subunit E2 [Alkalihalophilus marmarensis DSM 21297]MCM3488991.1 2-oxo acid dehydrogenase subunit E2 [Alkalihalophilus marmarensis]